MYILSFKYWKFQHNGKFTPNWNFHGNFRNEISSFQNFHHLDIPGCNGRRRGNDRNFASGRLGVMKKNVQRAPSLLGVVAKAADAIGDEELVEVTDESGAAVAGRCVGRAGVG